MSKKVFPLAYYYDGILSKNRIVLAQAISLAESNLPEDQTLSSALITKLLPHIKSSFRLGITGVPGVGKSSFIEAFGQTIIDAGHQVAVLTIDPSSQLTKGSILGDKTRMETLSKNKAAFIRPSASGNKLGGVAHKTREAILLCEAAGFDFVLVETVGIGQSETLVKSMVDFFMLLILPGAGDDLQGIKKGIMEMADGFVVTKADNDNQTKANKAQADLQHALHLFPAQANDWIPKVIQTSVITKKGLHDVWEMLATFKNHQTINGYFEHNRQQQQIAWMQEYFQFLIESKIANDVTLKEKEMGLKKSVAAHELTPIAAATELFQLFLNKK